METVYLAIELHHGGYFGLHPVMHYNGGEENVEGREDGESINQAEIITEGVSSTKDIQNKTSSNQTNVRQQVGRQKLPIKRKHLVNAPNDGKRAARRELIPRGFGTYISPKTGDTYISTTPGRVYLAGVVPTSGNATENVVQPGNYKGNQKTNIVTGNEKGKGKSVMSTREPKKRANTTTKLMSTAIRVGEAYKDITETNNELMTEALYNSITETRGGGRAEGEGQSSGVSNNILKAAGTQESACKK